MAVSPIFNHLLERIVGRTTRPNKNEVRPEGQTAIVSSDTIALIDQAAAIRGPYKCTHSGPAWFTLSVYGEKTQRISSSACCPSCTIEYLRKNVIRCAACGKPILPGEGAVLYSPALTDVPYLDVATQVGDSVIGCLRLNCARAKQHFTGTGIWTETGLRPAVPPREPVVTFASAVGE